MFLNQALSTAGKLVLIVTALSVIMLFRGVWASDQIVHQASQSLTVAEFAQDHGHHHPSSLDHLHDESTNLTDQDHLLLHILGSFENHMPLDIAAVPLSSGQSRPESQRTPSPLPEKNSSLYRPPKV